MTTAAAQSAGLVTLTRYARSPGFWLLMLAAPFGARFFIPRADGTAIPITVGQRLPELSWGVAGICLGLVVSTLLLPAAYIYLRANANQRQPWELEEISPASRVAITLGRFGADVLILFAALAALTIAGIFLASLTLPQTGVRIGELVGTLWVIAAPALMLVAAIRLFFDAIPYLRSGLGDFAYLVIWLVILGTPTVDSTKDVGFFGNLADPVGFVRPLIAGSDLEDPSFAMGAKPLSAETVQVDVMAGVLSNGYLPSRAAWALAAILLAVLAGLLYRPHRPRQIKVPAKQRQAFPRFRAANRTLSPTRAGPAPLPWLNLLAAECSLITAGSLTKLTALACALIGLALGWQTAGLPASLLWLAFALSEHAGREENRGSNLLATTLPTGQWARRAAFVIASALWLCLLALPSALLAGEVAYIVEALLIGAVAGLMNSALALLSGSSFAPRLISLIAWYIFISGP